MSGTVLDCAPMTVPSGPSLLPASPADMGVEFEGFDKIIFSSPSAMRWTK